METSQSEGLLLEASYFGLCAATEDKKEGTSAFLEKRAPAVPRALKTPLARTNLGETHGKRQYFLRTEGGRPGELHRRSRAPP